MRVIDLISFGLCMALLPTILSAADTGLVGHWPLRGDCRDRSGHDLDGVNHGVNLESGQFDGRSAYIEIPNRAALAFADGNFSIAAEIFTEKGFDDCLGDVVSKFDAANRRGFSLTLVSNTSGYNSQSDQRQLFFGLDDGKSSSWKDCGRPGGKTNSTDALTVFDGDLYVGTVDAPNTTDWAHVFRYRGDTEWEDCGRVGERKTRGVYAMIVHDGALYAATAGSHGGPNANSPNEDFGRVYRFRGDKKWEEIGEPGNHYRINSLASFRGKLYALSINTYGASGGGVYVYDSGRDWRKVGDFGRPHVSGVHDGRLYAAFPKGEVYVYGGKSWDNLGNPFGSLELCNQIHSLGIYRGELYVGTWPLGKVAVRRNDKWIDAGRLGDATEIVGLTVYNGSLYGGSIPRAEVFRFKGSNKWESMGRLFDPPNFKLLPVGSYARGIQDWTRASSLTVYNGKLFSSMATCYRAQIDPPIAADDVRGKVFCLQTGSAISVDRDIGTGWRHIAATREGDTLTLFVDGKLAASSHSSQPKLVTSCDAPLQIGFGPQSYFRGKIRDVRLYNRALNENEVEKLAASTAEDNE
jgi:Concanavalin A-like lectin/glucanases superfamily